MKPRIIFTTRPDGQCQCGKFKFNRKPISPNLVDDRQAWRIVGSIADCPDKDDPNQHFRQHQYNVSFINNGDDDCPPDLDDMGFLPMYLHNDLNKRIL